MTTSPPAGGRRAQLEQHRAAARLDDRRLRDRGHHAPRTPRCSPASSPTRSSITLPQGQQPAFALAAEELGRRLGDGGGRQGRRRRPGRHPRRADPVDGAARRRRAPGWSSVPVRASARSPCPGLPLDGRRAGDQPGAAAMMREHVAEVAAAARRHRRRRGGGLGRPRRGDRPARPGTRGSASSAACRSSARPGVVVPYSCSAWIDCIRRGIDVAAAVGPHPRRGLHRVDLASRS